MEVKICGVKSLEIAKYSIDLGADLIGLNFAEASPRKINLEILNEIYSGLFKINEEKKIVALFYKTNLNLVKEILKNFTFEYIQIVHEDDSMKRINFQSKKIIQFGVSHEISDEELNLFQKDSLILDSSSSLGGGTGKSFNWSLVKNIKRNYFLAGGLNPKNILEAKEKLNPYGVDVASGVEIEKGVKNKNLIKEFIENAKRN